MPFRIAVTADPEIAVPPIHYGGIERIVDMLVRGLVARGHDVTLFAHPESSVPCRLKAYPSPTFRSRVGAVRNMFLVSRTIATEPFDLVHSFGRLGYLLPILPGSMPKIMSYQRPVSLRSVDWGVRLSRGSLHVTGCSRALMTPLLGRDNCHVIYNGVPRGLYRFSPSVPDDAPLVFLGRVEEIKGPHIAIDVAQRTGRRLLIAGGIPDEPVHHAFFDKRVRPYVDGDRIRFVGPVNDEQKNDLLGSAAALLMPIQWDEPFGIVMAEALACGTPVIGLRRGSVPEVVTHGRDGFVCVTVDEMAHAVDLLSDIDRLNCRRSMEARFSDDSIVSAYEHLYASICPKTEDAVDTSTPGALARWQ